MPRNAECWRECVSCGLEFDYYSAGYCCDDCDAYTCAACGSCRCDDDRCDCSDCLRARADDDCGVHSWDYDPYEWNPKGIDHSVPQVVCGMELEVGGTAYDIARAVHETDSRESHLYMKRDGSISGVEIVSHPATLAWSREFGYAEMLDRLSVYGATVPSDGYGLHVHVARSSFRRKSPSHQMAWLLLLYRNSRQLERLARRRSEQWAAFRALNPGELTRKATRAPYRDDRYQAVNSNNHETYELRFFKSTLSPVEFYSALEFADASVEYTRPLKSQDVLRGAATTWEHFAAWVDNNADTYPNLLQELDRVARFSRHTR